MIYLIFDGNIIMGSFSGMQENLLLDISIPPNYFDIINRKTNKNLNFLKTEYLSDSKYLVLENYGIGKLVFCNNIFISERYVKIKQAHFKIEDKNAN